MNNRYEIRYGAVGGQGIITAGALLVDIAVELEDKYALESPTYTATVRGGPTKVDVIVSDQKVMFPQASAIDFCVCTHQTPYDLYKQRIKDDAIVILDSNLVTDLGDTKNWKLFHIPIIAETKKEVGNIMFTSVVTLSMTQKLTGIIEYDNMVNFIKHKFAAKGQDLVEANMKAIEVGKKLIS